MTNGYISASNSVYSFATSSKIILTSRTYPHIVGDVLDIGDPIESTADASGIFHWQNLMPGFYEIKYQLTRRDTPHYIWVDVPDVPDTINLLNYTVAGVSTGSLFGYDSIAQNKIFVRKDNIGDHFIAGPNINLDVVLTAGTQSITISSFSSGSLDPNANYNLTASNAINSIHSQTAISASWASSSVSSSYAQTGPFTLIVTASTVPITASWSNTAVTATSASYATFAQSSPAQIITGSTIPITASVAISGGSQLVTGSTVPITSSIALNAITSNSSTSASFATQAATASLAVNANQAISASFAPPQFITGSTLPVTSSVALMAINSTAQLTTGSTVPITASVALNAVTSSYSIFSQGSTAQITTGSTVPITASVALVAITSSYSTFAQGSSAQITTGSTVPITSSVALTAITSSYATFAQSSPAQITTGSIVPITASVAITSLTSTSSSYAEESHTSSFANNLKVKNVLTVVGNITSSGIYIPATYTQKFVAGDGSIWTVSTDTSGKLIYTNDADGGILSITTDGVLINSQLQCGLVTSLTSSTVAANRILTTGNASSNGYISFKTTDTASIYQITASQSVSASWAPNASSANNLVTGSTVPITSSRAITSSYAQALQHDPTIDYSANLQLRNANDAGFQAGVYSKANDDYALGIDNLDVYVSRLILNNLDPSRLMSTDASGHVVTNGAIVSNDGTITGSITFATTASTVRNVFARPMKFWANNFFQDTGNDWWIYNTGSLNTFHIKNLGDSGDYQFTTDGIFSAVTINASDHFAGNLTGTASALVGGVSHLKGMSSTPTIVSGSGAGFTASINITGSDTAGQIQITTGTSPTTGGVIGTITFASNYTTAPFVTMWPASANAGTLGSLPFVTSNTASFNISASTVLAASTKYIYNYHVIA